jgi:hypothetical protein
VSIRDDDSINYTDNTRIERVQISCTTYVDDVLDENLTCADLNGFSPFIRPIDLHLQNHASEDNGLNNA